MQQTAAKPASRRATGAVTRSLLWRVMTLVVVGMAAVVIAFGVASLLAVNESRDHTLEERRALAQAAARHVDYVVRQSLGSLDGLSLAEGFDLADDDAAPEQWALRRTYLTSIFSRGIYLVDAKGRLLLTEPAGLTGPGVDLGSMPIIGDALMADRPSVSGLTPGIGDGTPVVAMAAPVRDDDGVVQGAVVGEIGLDGASLAEIITSAGPGETGYAQIVDRSGTVLASTVEADVFQENPHETLVSGLAEGSDGYSGSCHSCHDVPELGPVAGEQEVMAFAPLEAAPWAVMIRQPESEALAPARRLEERAIWLGVPAFALALLFAWATVRSVLGPVRALTAASQRLASGDLSQPVPAMGNDEIGRLGLAFESMRVRLKEALETVENWARELESRVHERTAELEASRDELRAAADANAALYEEVKRKDEARGELLKRVITAQEEERRRIARELHDETSQNLSVLAMGLETAGAQGAPAAAGSEKLGGLRDLAVKTLDGVHRLVYDLRPSVLDDLGLLAGLRWYAESRLEPLGVRVSLMVTGEERRLPAELETAVFRIGQEAITNIARHARAANVFVGVGFGGDKITLEVEDDGEGFDVNAQEPGTEGRGWGLLGIRERASLLGGSMEMTSEPSQGTRIEVNIPLPAKTGEAHAE
jgi:signal transduction histidine kinase